MNQLRRKSAHRRCAAGRSISEPNTDASDTADSSARRLNLYARSFRCRIVASALLCFAVIVFESPAVRAEAPLDGDLFSEISMSDTVIDASQQLTSPAKVSAVVLGPAALSAMLDEAGVANEVESQAVRVDLESLLPTESDAVKRNDLRFRIDAEAGRIDVVLPIEGLTVGARDDGATVDGETLMALLAALQNHSHVQLVASGKTLAFQSSLGNHDVTPERLRVAAKRLTSVAANTASMVSAVMVKRSVAQSSTETAPPSQPLSTLVGTWSAKTSASDAWAVRFAGDDSFVMVHTKNGKNSVSRGKYNATAERLELNESAGGTLAGTLQRSSADAFRWQLQNSNGDVVATLAFEKQ
ncbi:hypothetical protein [Stieleria mannarensis]|uniref:hypothetical protein n=1 Tax=Stieleria mannarensis TaxID=2755585 RepID=UPI001603471D|nr:hypothetical protein [Rhodopirellula sp. JC639]